jgi:hypothetical protein
MIPRTAPDDAGALIRDMISPYGRLHGESAQVCTDPLSTAKFQKSEREGSRFCELRAFLCLVLVEIEFSTTFHVQCPRHSWKEGQHRHEVREASFMKG